VAKRYTDEQALVKLDYFKALLPRAEAENPTKDFIRLRSLLDLIERAILAKNYDVEQGAWLECEHEWFRLDLPGIKQKHLDC